MATDLRKEWVTAQLAERKWKDTPANRKKLREEYTQQGSNDREAALRAKVREIFPEYVSLLNGDFGTDVADLLKRAVIGNYEPRRFQAEYRNTQYYQTTTAAARVWDAATPAAKEAATNTVRTNIQDLYGDVVTDDKTLNRIASGAARLNLGGTQLKQYVFAQASKTQTDIAQSSEADRIRQLAADYGYRLSESELKSVLTGEMEAGRQTALTEQQLVERAKQSLLGEMPNLKPQVDAGLTLANMFRNYQNVAADTLELDPNTVTINDSKFRRAMSTPDGKGGFRQLSLGEWQQTLRTDPQYKFFETRQANRDATDIGLAIAKAFGKTGA